MIGATEMDKDSMTSTTRRRRILAAIGTILAAVAVLVGAAGPSASASGPDQGDSAAQHAVADSPTGVADPKIIGGTAPTQNYPAGAMTSLNYDAPSHGVTDWFTCGATLVFGNTIVTSAHCVTDPPAPAGSKKLAKILDRFPDIKAQTKALARIIPDIKAQTKALPIPTKDKSFYVRVGSQDRTAGVRANAYVVWVDPEWDWAEGPNPVNDIAVLKLDHSLDVQTVPLGDGPLADGTEVFGVGWGFTSADWSESIPTMIQEMRSTTVPAARCADAVISTRDLCVDNPFGTDGPCSGDSGGPLLAYDRHGVMRLYGNLSRFFGPTWCGESPYVYTSTSEFRTEIVNAARLPIPTQRKGEPTYSATPVPVAGS